MDGFITIVSGLPRSGTSMMMKMLEAGGMELVVDNIRQADEDNPNGYYEFEKVKKIKEDFSWLEETTGKAFKMVSVLLYNLPAGKHYKIIFMERKMEEMIASQNKMLERKDLTKNESGDEKMGEFFKNHLNKIKQWFLGQKNMEILYVNYNSLIDDSQKNAENVNRFIGGNLDTVKMSSIVDKSLYRQRK